MAGNASPDWLREFRSPIESAVQLSSSSSPSTSLSGDDVRKKSSGGATTSAFHSSHLEMDKSQGAPHLRKGVISLTDSEDEAPETTQSQQNVKEGSAFASERNDGGSSRKIRKQQNKEQQGKHLQGVQKAANVSVAKPGERKLNVSESDYEDEDDVLPLVEATKRKDVRRTQQEESTPVHEDNLHEEENAEEQDRRSRLRIASSLPLVFADKVHTSKVLIECEDNALDLSGDIGAVGRFSAEAVHDKGSVDLVLDLKGILYKAAIIPSNSFFVVNMGPSEAKIEAVINDFLQLQHHTNANENETMIEGTLDGLMFDSEDEGERRHLVADSGAEQNLKAVAKGSARKQIEPAIGKKESKGKLLKAKVKGAGIKSKPSKKSAPKRSMKSSLTKNSKARK